MILHEYYTDQDIVSAKTDSDNITVELFTKNGSGMIRTLALGNSDYVISLTQYARFSEAQIAYDKI